MSKYSEKLKKGDKVVMHTCGEAESNIGQIWTCKTDQFTRGTGVYEQDSVFLEGYSGSFAPEFLQKVILPSEDNRVLAALEEAQQQVRIKSEEIEIRKGNVKVVTADLKEAQQTISRMKGPMHISMGRGDIAIVPASSEGIENGIGFVKRKAEYPIAVDVDCDVTDEEIAEGTLGYMTFSNSKSIDALVTMLQRLKANMLALGGNKEGSDKP